MSGIQSLETAVQSGALINLDTLWLANTLTDNADVNGALLTTLLQSIACHCAGPKHLDLSKNNLGSPGLCSILKTIPIGLHHINLHRTRPTTSFHSESQYTVTCDMLSFSSYNLCSLTVMNLSSSNFSGTAGTLLLAKLLQAFQSLEYLECSDCSLTSADIIRLIHHLKSADVICKNLYMLDLSNNSIDDEGVMALTKCLPELFPSLDNFKLGDFEEHMFSRGDVDLHGNPVRELRKCICVL